MVDFINFIQNNPEITQKCLVINQDINNSLNKYTIPVDELSFDILLPFLISEFTDNEEYNIAKELRIHREIVDFYNKDLEYPSSFDEIITKEKFMKPITLEEYRHVNKTKRRYINESLTSSYILSTDRVYYRSRILERFEKNINTGIIRKIKLFSAFLLFDDDVYDLEEDLNCGKTTILIDFLKSGNKIDDGIQKMIKLIENGPDLFNQFTRQFKLIYES